MATTPAYNPNDLEAISPEMAKIIAATMPEKPSTAQYGPIGGALADIGHNINRAAWMRYLLAGQKAYDSNVGGAMQMPGGGAVPRSMAPTVPPMSAPVTAPRMPSVSAAAPTLPSVPDSPNAVGGTASSVPSMASPSMTAPTPPQELAAALPAIGSPTFNQASQARAHPPAESFAAARESDVASPAPTAPDMSKRTLGAYGALPEPRKLGGPGPSPDLPPVAAPSVPTHKVSGYSPEEIHNANVAQGTATGRVTPAPTVPPMAIAPPDNGAQIGQANLPNAGQAAPMPPVTPPAVPQTKPRQGSPFDFLRGNPRYNDLTQDGAKPLDLGGLNKVILHDRGGSYQGQSPYHIEVLPDGRIMNHWRADQRAPHAYLANPTSIGVAYGGQVGSTPTPAALESLRTVTDGLKQWDPNLQFQSHGEAFRDTRGTPQQASRTGRGLEEASWRTQVLAPNQAPVQVADASGGQPDYAALRQQIQSHPTYQALPPMQQKALDAIIGGGAGKAGYQPQMPERTEAAPSGGRMTPEQDAQWRAQNGRVLRDPLVKEWYDKHRPLTPEEARTDEMQRLSIEKARRDLDQPAWQLTDGPKDKYGNPTKVWANTRTQEVKPLTGGSLQPTGPDPASLHGEEFLKSIDPTIANQVKGIAEGRLPYPSAFALKVPYWQKVTEALSQYEPGADANTFKTRGATYKDMATGKMGQNVASFNTALGHMHDLYEQIDGLGNSDVPILNAPINAIKSRLSDTAQAKRDTFNATAGKVIAETEKAFKGMGATVDDMKHAREELNADKSPASLKAVTRKYLDLMESRITALHDQYDRGMALGQPRQGLHLLSPKSREIIAKLKGEGGHGAAPQAGADSQAPVRVSSPEEAAALAPGTRFVTHDGREMVKH